MFDRFLSAAVFVQLAAGGAFSQVHNTLSEVEKAQGFTLLYDGTRTGFNANFVDYIKNNTTNTNLSSDWTVDTATGAIGIQSNTEDVRSRKIYKDFDLRMDYRCDGNQGVFYRTKVTTDRAWQTGIEVAINNYTSQNRDAPGAAYDLYPPNPNSYFMHNSGKWNQLRVVAKADSIEHWMNGKRVVAFRLHSPDFWTAYASSKWNTSKTLTYKEPGDRNAGYITEGYLGLQADHGGKWEIRNFKISESPCLGPVNPIRMTRECSIPTGIHDVAAPAPESFRAVLRRTSGGLTLHLGGGGAREASLLSLDGKSWSSRIAEGAANFPGTFKTGLYIVRMKTATGEVTRKLNVI